MVKREDIDEDELSDDDLLSAKEVVSYQTEPIQEEENTIEERLQTTKDIVITDE